MNNLQHVRLSRRAFMKKIVWGLAGGAFLAGSYSFGWERNWVEMVRLTMSLPQLPPAWRGAKIAHFSDLHLGHFCSPADVQVVVDLINQEKPDFICFTGDLVEDGTDMLAEAVPVLAQMDCPYGKYAVLGNHDYRNRESSLVRDALEASGFSVLDNQHMRLEKDDAALYVAGVDDVLLGRPDLHAALHGIPDGETVILLAHEPDFAEVSSQFPVHIQLSGHSHGGQVRLPFLGALVTPPLARNYVQGLAYAGERGMPVYTNRGLGTTQLPIRFLCRPEITVLTLA